MGPLGPLAGCELAKPVQKKPGEHSLRTESQGHPGDRFQPATLRMIRQASSIWAGAMSKWVTKRMASGWIAKQSTP